MQRWLFLSLLMFGLIAPSYAQATRIDRIEIIDWGIYQNNVMSKVAAPGTPSGTINRVKDVLLQHATTTIPALVGMKFGFRYRIVGSPNGAMVSLKLVSRFPSQGLKNPKKSEVFLRDEWHSNQVGFRRLRLAPRKVSGLLAVRWLVSETITAEGDGLWHIASISA